MRRLFRAVLPALCLAGLPVVAQEQPAGQAVSAKLIESRLKEVEASTDLDETTSKALIEMYRKAVSFIEAADANNAMAETFVQALQAASDDARGIRDKLAADEAEAPPVTLGLPDDAAAQEIDQRLQTERANQAAVAAKLDTLDQQISTESNRPGAARQRLVQANQLREQLAAELQQPARTSEPALLTEARRWMLSSQSAAVIAEIRMLDEELRSQPMRVELLKAQRDATSRTLGRIDTRLQMLEARLTEQRRIETRQVIADAGLEGLGEAAYHPVVQALAMRNRDLVSELENTTTDLERAEADAAKVASQLKAIQESFQTARRYLEVAGPSKTLGQVLDQQRRDLPDLREFGRKARLREQTIGESGLRNIRFEAERRELLDEAAYVQKLLADVPEAQRVGLLEAMRQLANSRRTLLSKTITASNEYLRTLGELEFQEKQLLITAAEFDAFLSERLLWVRNKDLIGFDAFLALPQEIGAFLNPMIWLEVLQVLIRQATTAPTIALALLVAGVLLWKSSALHRALRATAAVVGNTRKDRYAVTVMALVYTILLALPWPLLAAATGWEVRQSLDASDEAKGIGFGLWGISRAILFVSLGKALCKSGGMAEAHFRWPASLTRRLRRQLDQLLLTFILPAFVVSSSVARDPANYGGELARVAFVAAIAGLVAFLWRLLHPTRGIMTGIRLAEGETSRMSRLWLALGSLIPSGVAVAALAGYLYSAASLTANVMSSLWLLFGLLLVHELVARWLLMIRQRLLMHAALERREAARAARAIKLAESGAGEDPQAPPEEPAVDVAGLDADTRQLLKVGLFLSGAVGLAGIWSSVLPALAGLEEITLWEYFAGVAGEQQLTPVTLADVILAIVVLAITLIAARTIPSLLEAILRQRDTVTAGSRLAFATLARYGIVLIGVAVVASSIGFDWSRIQWLVAALGVGIGFGLQEIVANFISGLIILLERPVRVGDIVTVGDVSGTVTRVQIRATTVTNWDRQELLVPNKEFITGRVLNWSLSDEVIRVVVTVGVAYGSDMRKALDLIREVIEAHERVLADPRPLITFDAFGDNSLLITARCLIDSLKHRRETASELNLAINERLAEAGIVVAFPQRDVHLDTSSPLEVHIHEQRT